MCAWSSRWPSASSGEHDAISTAATPARNAPARAPSNRSGIRRASTRHPRR